MPEVIRKYNPVAAYDLKEQDDVIDWGKVLSVDEGPTPMSLRIVFVTEDQALCAWVGLFNHKFDVWEA